MPARPTLSEKLRTVPLLVALVPLVAGILFGTYITIPLYIWTVAATICSLTAIFALSRRPRNSNSNCPHGNLIPNLYTALAILFFGAALTRAHTPRVTIPRGERLLLELQITDNPVRHDDRRSTSASGLVTRWQPTPPVTATHTDITNSTSDPIRTASPNLDPDLAISQNPTRAARQSSRERLLVSVDTAYRFETGDRITFIGYVNPVSDSVTSYSRLMLARGYTGRTYVSQYSEPVISPQKQQNLKIAFTKLQAAATERLHRLRVPTLSDEIAVAAAMTTGDRSTIPPRLREAYSRTGASHLLAVSGLHVGIVFLIINILLYLLPLLPRGHIAKNIAAIVAIWLYAALTGLSPSATRAAFMFSGAQLALASSRTRNSANIMCATAIVMFVVRPGLLFDISFQLSFIAVAAIMVWFPQLYSLVESRFKLLGALWTTLIVGLVASVATMPLVSHTFGVVSPVGIILNPVVITTAHLIVVFSLVWIAAPVPLLEPVFRWLVGGPAWLQNRVVELASTVPGVAIEYTLPLGAVFAIYALMTIFTIRYAVGSRNKSTE